MKSDLNENQTRIIDLIASEDDFYRAERKYLMIYIKGSKSVKNKLVEILRYMKYKSRRKKSITSTL
jgi:hypothetical protein